MPPAPIRVVLRGARHALGGACRAGVPDVADVGAACLGSATWPRRWPLPATTTCASVEARFPEV